MSLPPPAPSLAEIARRLAAGETTAVAEVRRCLDRIEALDGRLGAFARVAPDAAERAAALDRGAPKRGRGPLAGVAVAVKDNIVTRGLETSCGSSILRGFVPTRDATVVERLRRAGAVVVGKTNLDAFGMGSSTESSDRGATRNPWNTGRVAGGSSGGSAAAVAAGLVPAALGSDTGGSVRQPAAMCGVVGLKPTYGRVSRSGLVAYASSFEQVGCIGRTVGDAARLLQAIAGHDPDDATTVDRPVGAYVDACAEGVAGLRVGMPVEFFDAALSPDVAGAVRDAGRALEAAGARVEELSLPHTRFAAPAYYLIAMAEASSNLARFDGMRYGRRVDPGGGLLEASCRSRGSGLGPEVRRRILLGTYVLAAGFGEAYYRKAQRVRRLVRREFLRTFASGVDLLLTPTTPTTAFRLGERLDDPLAMYLSDLYTTPVNLAGLPALSVPLGTDGAGLPVGGQLIGADFAEESVCRAAAVIEQRFPPRRPAGYA